MQRGSGASDDPHQGYCNERSQANPERDGKDLNSDPTDVELADHDRARSTEQYLRQPRPDQGAGEQAANIEGTKNDKRRKGEARRPRGHRCSFAGCAGARIKAVCHGGSIPYGHRTRAGFAQRGVRAVTVIRPWDALIRRFEIQLVTFVSSSCRKPNRQETGPCAHLWIRVGQELIHEFHARGVRVRVLVVHGRG